MNTIVPPTPKRRVFQENCVLGEKGWLAQTVSPSSHCALMPDWQKVLSEVIQCLPSGDLGHSYNLSRGIFTQSIVYRAILFPGEMEGNV